MMYSVAFDLDGTLLDLPVEIEKARAEIAAMFAEMGYHEPMRPILDAINRAAATVAKNDNEIFPLILKARRLLDAAEVEAASRATPRPGAIEALAKLREKNIPLAIVTNNSRACVALALQCLRENAENFAVSTRDDVRRPKPAPDGLIRVAANLPNPGSILWYIGDSPVDVSAAVAANPQVSPNVRPVAIPGPRSSMEQLRFAGPCVIYPSLEEAVDFILSQA